MRRQPSGRTSPRATSTLPSRLTRRAVGSSASFSSLRRHREGSDLPVRLATAIIGIPLVVLADYAGGFAFGAAIGVVALVSAWELDGLLRNGGFRPVPVLPIAGAISVAVLPGFYSHPERLWMLALMSAVLVFGAFFLIPSPKPGAASSGAGSRGGSGEGTRSYGAERYTAADRDATADPLTRIERLRGDSARGTVPLASWMASVAPLVYVGLLLGLLYLLRETRHGAWWVGLVLLVTWAYDTGAYFAGRMFGSRPFMAHISPKKTWEGVAGGLALCIPVALAGVPAIGLTWWHCLILGAVLGTVAQTGDLLESFVKRQVGVKDSGRLLPGHGGLLDRIDGLLFAAAAGYYAAALLGYAA